MTWKDWLIIILIILVIFFAVGWIFGDLIPETPGFWP